MKFHRFFIVSPNYEVSLAASLFAFIVQTDKQYYKN